MHEIHNSASYDALFACLQEHRRAAQRAIKDKLRGQRISLQDKHGLKWQRLWYSKRERAYAQVFLQTRDEQGSAPMHVHAVQHQLYGPNAQKIEIEIVRLSA